MRITRRSFLASATACLPARLWARTEIEFGGRQVLSLSDGHLELPMEFIFGTIPEEERSAILTAHGLSTTGPLIAPCNVTLLRDGDRITLFDVGAGPDFQTSAGQLFQALEAAGVTPEQITDVVFTHAHPDHLWGLLDDFDDLRFPQARHFIGRIEYDYWTDPATVETIGPARTAFAVGAARRLEVIDEIAIRIEDGDQLDGGITALLTPGHTPGHLSFDLGGLLVTGDCIGNGHVSFDRPAALLGSDQDPQLAADTRVALMRRLAEAGTPILGFHLPAGGIGKIVSAGAAYRFEPA